MKVNNNTDSKATLQHWIKNYIRKTVKHLRWSFLLEIASCWNPLAISAKKLPLRWLTGLQVNKNVDDTHDKGPSKLT